MSKPEDQYKERDEQIREELRASGMAFIRTLLTFPDIKEAIKMGKEHAGQDFDRAYAGEMEALALDCAKGDERADASRDALHDLEKQKRATKSHLKVSEVRGTGERKEIPYVHWDLKDRLVFPLSLILMVLMLGAGSGNIYSAIMAEADVVFLENPILAILLSCLLPAGSVAIHSLGDLLGSDRSRKRYMLAILFLTALLLFSWAILFGRNFQIGDGGIDWEALSRPAEQTSTAFTIVQLLSEMFCGASLALIAGHTHSRYSGDTTTRNPEAETLDELIADITPEYEDRHEWRKGPRGRKMQLPAMREVHISEQVALYLAMRRRFDDSNPL